LYQDLSMGAAPPRPTFGTSAWLAVAIALIGGLLVGFFFGSNFAEQTPFVGRDSATINHPGTHPANDGAITRSPETQPHVLGTREWLEESTTALEQAAPGQPTPRLVEIIKDAMQAEGNYADQARLLLLIDIMRKEDFPVAVEIFAKAQSGALTTSAGGNGHPVWNAFWRRFGELDPVGAVDAAFRHRDLDYPGRDYLEKHLFAGIARTDPAKAAELFLASESLPNRDKGLGGLMREWANLDPKAAAAWAQSRLDPAFLGTAYYGAAMGLAKIDDLSAAIDFAKDTPAGIPRLAFLQSVRDTINRNKHTPARQLLDFVAASHSLGDQNVKFDLSIAKRVAVQDPLLAADFFAAQVNSNNEYPELRVILQTWSQTDRKALESWAKGQKGKPHYGTVVEELNRAQVGN
jgi:hypothetical protein